MKQVLLLLFVLCVNSIYSQVGINTVDPKATLDVTATKTDASTAEGIIAPRLTRTQLGSKDTQYAANQIGTIVYVTDILGTTTAKTINVSKIGYHYFDGILWQPFSSSGGSNPNDWSLTGNANTSRATNYIGTSNAQDLVLKTAGTERMTVSATGNVGIGTPAPTNALHLKAATNPIKIEGLAASNSENDRPIVVGTDGTLKTGVFPTVNIVPEDVGTVIAVDGKLEIAQEMTILMSADYNFDNNYIDGKPPIHAIGNLDVEIIDNESKFVGTATGNSFSVTKDGTYQIIINILLKSEIGGSPVVGIWDNNGTGTPTGNWIARVNALSVNHTLGTHTLITAIDLLASHTYSFRVASTSASSTLYAYSEGATGRGPVSFFSLKRLK